MFIFHKYCSRFLKPSCLVYLNLSVNDSILFHWNFSLPQTVCIYFYDTQINPLERGIEKWKVAFVSFLTRSTHLGTQFAIVKVHQRMQDIAIFYITVVHVRVQILLTYFYGLINAVQYKESLRPKPAKSWEIDKL